MIKKMRSHHRFMWAYSKTTVKNFSRPAIMFLFFVLFSTAIISTIGIYHLEKDTNNNITSYFDAFYYTVTLFSGVGLGDIYPVTTGGRVLSMLIMLIGTAIYISLTAVVAATILSIEALPYAIEDIKKEFPREDQP